MIYIERNNQGLIIAIHREPGKNHNEQKSINDQEVLEFLNAKNEPDELISLLSLSDQESVRILEDLINLLVKKNIIQFTELPVDAQKKLINRRHLRSEMSKKSLLLEDDEIL